MFKFAKDNSANSLDIGWYGKIVSSGTKYAGIWYDASTGISTPKFNVGLATTEPGNTAAIATTGTVVANLEGNVTGNVTGNADTATQAANLNNHDTDDLSEGSSNLYYTDARADARIDARSSAHTITGDNSATEFTISYGFTAAAVNDVVIQVVDSYASSSHDGDTVYTEVERHSTTQCKIKFATAPATSHTYRVLCFKVA